MKLNICCGKRILPGYFNIDIAANEPGLPQPDLLAAAYATGMNDSSVNEILCVHGWEHFYLWECTKVIHEWKRILVPGGLLVLELPNLIKCAQNLINFHEGTMSAKNPDQHSMWGIYGDPTLNNPWMIHRWGWSPKTLTAFLSEHGFTNIREKETQFHPIGRANRDMRLEAQRSL